MLEELKNEEEPGEIVPEDAYKYSTPDSVWTPTACPDSEHTSIVRGDFRLDTGETSCPDLTLGLIKPDGMEHLSEIERLIREEGFYVVQVSPCRRRNREQA